MRKTDDEWNDTMTVAAAELTESLRVWLRRRREPPTVQAAALAYEMAALVALHAGSVQNAHAVVDAWTEVMKDQIVKLGVEVEHP